MNGSRLVVRNVVVTLGTQLVTWALSFLVTLYLPPYAGDAGLGKLAFAASFVAIFAAVAPIGTSIVLMKEIARERGRAGELLAAAICLRVPVGLTLAALAIGIVHWLGYPALTR